MPLADDRKNLETMKADFATLKDSDLEFFGHVAGSNAAALAGAVWKPHAHEEAMVVAAEFSSLADAAYARLDAVS